VERMASVHETGAGYRWSMLLRDDGAVIGSLGYHAWDRELRSADLSYEVVPARWGQGYATEAARGAMEYGFGTMGLLRIVGNVAQVNLPSIRVLQRLGFRQVGAGLREWGGREVPFLTFHADRD